jgi:Zn-dependent peptidase ImmA (M78 family)/transcriptional regulator with XRE-family HTH domain
MTWPPSATEASSTSLSIGAVGVSTQTSFVVARLRPQRRRHQRPVDVRELEAEPAGRGGLGTWDELRIFGGLCSLYRRCYFRTEMVKSQAELGNRVMSARKEQRLTQVELATAIGVDRTVITTIETGQRTVDALELARLAKALRRPIGWFVSDPPPSVVSRRADRGDVVRPVDIQLETLARDVEQLIELGVLTPTPTRSDSIDSIGAAEQAAFDARRAAGLRDDEPVWDLVRVAERLGLYAFVLDLDVREDVQTDGSYVALKECGVALINGAREGDRRRFTIAHELGHHVLNDEYDPEWIVGSDTTDRERVINAFALHFLMPRAAIEQRWLQLDGGSDPRGAAIRLAVEFGASWSAACAQLLRLGCLSAGQYQQLVPEKPTSFDLAERELTLRDDAVAPLMPPGYGAAVIRALKKTTIGPNRALELLHGTIHESDLPAKRPLSLESMTAELKPLPD